MAANERIIVFSKIPQRGRVKTRLVPDIGEEQALRLYEVMLEHTLKTIGTCGVPAQISFWGSGDPGVILRGLSLAFSLFPQIGKGLGEKMTNAFERVFAGSVERAVIVGCDIPQLRPGLLTQAFSRLRSCDVVLGPADDGGYYLVGLTRESFSGDLFADIPWGSEKVLSRTLEKASTLGLTVGLLDTLLDVDTGEDLDRLAGIWRDNPPEDNPVHQFLKVHDHKRF